MNSAELNRKIENIVRIGEIAESNAAQALVRVKSGENLSDWLSYFVPAAGGVSVHRVPSVGEACLILSPSGELAAGVVLCGFASVLFPNPSKNDADTRIRFADGAMINYNHSSSHLDAIGMKSAKIQASNQVEIQIELCKIDAQQTICTGKLTVQGLLTYQSGMTGTGGASGTTVITGNFTHTSGNLSSNGIILHTHTHLNDGRGAPR